MGAEEGLKVLSDIAAADSMTYWIVGALTLVVFLVMRAMLPVKGLSLVFAPAIFWGGLTGVYTSMHMGIFLTHEKASNIVMTSALGMILALVIMVLLARAVEAVLRIRKPLTSGSPVAVPEPRRVRI